MSINVNVAPGTYDMRGGLQLDQRDFGNSSRNMLTFRSTQPGAAILEMGVRVNNFSGRDTNWWNANETRIHSSVRPNVFVADLASQGITNLGAFRGRKNDWNSTFEGRSWPRNPNNISDFSELVVNNRIQRLASWPPSDQTITTATPRVFQRADGYNFVTGRGPADTSATAPIEDWRNWVLEFQTNLSGCKTPVSAFNNSDIWFRGNLGQSRFFEVWERFISLDTSQGWDRALMRLDPNNEVGAGDGNRRLTHIPTDPGRFQIVNSIYELDEPGEYFVDRQNGRLFFYPPADFDPSQGVFLTQASNPVFTIDRSRFVSVNGFTMQNGRNLAVHMRNTEFSRIEGNRIRNFGFIGLYASDSRGNIVRDNEMSDIGETAIDVNGGDRPTLTAGGNLVANNFITRWGRNLKFYRPAVRITGVGNVVERNTMADAPGSAILFRGNDLTMRNNVIIRSNRESGDDGAIITNHDITNFGNVIDNNLIADINRIRYGRWPNAAIFMDGFSGGTTISNNVMRRVFQSVNTMPSVGMIIRNNAVINGEDGICIPSEEAQFDQGYWQTFNQMPWQNNLWRQRYPMLYDFLMSSTKRNMGWFVERNVGVGSGSVILGEPTGNFNRGNFTDNNQYPVSPFDPVQKANRIFTTTAVRGFQAIDMNNVGSTLPAAQAWNETAQNTN